MLHLNNHICWVNIYPSKYFQSIKCGVNCPGLKKVLLEVLQNSRKNTCVRASFLLKFQTLLKKELWHRCFPVNFAKFQGTFFYRTSPVAASNFFRHVILRSGLLCCRFCSSGFFISMDVASSIMIFLMWNSISYNFINIYYT